MAKQQPCKLVESGKHKWTFVKNTTTAKMSFGPGGSHGTFSVRGLYRCECGAARIGQANHDAPGADLRDHLPTRAGV